MTKRELARGKERYRQDYAQYLQEGWMREVYDAGWGMFCALSESAYVVFLYGIIDKTVDLTVYFYFLGDEMWLLLEEPTYQNFMAGFHEFRRQNINRAGTMSPQLAGKFRDLYNNWDPNKPRDIDRVQEAARLAEIAKKRDSGRSRFARNARNTLQELFGE